MLNIFFSENSAVYEIMLKNMVNSERPQMTIILRIPTRWWVTKVMDAHRHILLTAVSKGNMRFRNNFCKSGMAS